jgi:hypothetical protein
MASISNQIIPTFECIYCNLITSNKKDYAKHILTRKHASRSNPQPFLTKNPKTAPEHTCSNCNKEYESRSGLWRHVKKCGTNETNTTADSPTEVKTLTTMVMELMKSNSELQKQMVEMCKNSNNNINNNTVNSNNKTFNLQFFLNEQCKDAMNLSDFMNSFELGLEDLESIGELGYVEGITKIMVDRLNAMDIYKRPVHCSDAKRETLYVKNDDRWEKEARNNPKLRYAIKTASFQSMKLTVLWSETYPESKSSESRLNDKYMKLVFNSTGGHGEIADSEDKIIRRILKEIVIDKK